MLYLIKMFTKNSDDLSIEFNNWYWIEQEDKSGSEILHYLG